MSWKDEPYTEKQRCYIEDIYDYSEYQPPMFTGTTKGEAAEYIDKYGKLAHESLWAIENGYD